MIKTYLSDYMKLYKKITPKLHFLSHYGRMIRMFGAPKNCWVMRFEAKHSYFKRVQHSIHNTINTSKSLAKRHQYLQVNKLNSMEYLKFDIVETGPIKKISISTMTMIKDSLSDDLDITNVKWATYKSIKYQLGCVIFTPNKLYGKIEHIVVQGNNLFLESKVLHTY